MSDRCHKCHCRLSPEHDLWAGEHQFCTECFESRLGPDAIKIIGGLRDQVAGLIDILRSIEWSGSVDGWEVCPVCSMTKDEDGQGHATDCVLWEAISR